MTPTARLLSVAAIFLLAAPLASATREAFPGKAGKLVFQSNRDGNYELYVANANGSGVKRLLSRPETDEFNANWSPSGTKIVFQTGPPDRSTYDIWIVNADGRGAKPLVAETTNDRAPQFCDEKTVVFTRQLTATNAEVYAVGTDGKGLRQLTDHPASDSFPTCNPKGTRIAFITSRDGAPRIYEMTRTGSGLRALADGVDPDYSSDGKALAYVAPDADRNLEVFTKSLASGKVTQRTNVKPPFEYRLPKFVPEAATRRASGRADEADAIVATQRNTQTSAEEVHRVQGGTAPPPIAPGSGGSVRPLVPCKCEQITVDVVNASRQVGERGGARQAIVRIDVRWRMLCSPGSGGCKGVVRGLKGRDLTFGEGRTINCRGPCDRVTGNTERLVGTGDPASLKFRVDFGTLCEDRDTPITFTTLVFDKAGRLDRGKSELGG